MNKAISETFTGRLLFILALAATASACQTQKKLRTVSQNFNYLQKSAGAPHDVRLTPLTIQPNDILSINVTSTTMSQGQVAIFAVTNTGGLAQQAGIMGQQMAPAIFGYLVDADGHITFPLLGRIRAGGLTREELAAYIQGQLTVREFVKEPSVLVRFTNLRVNVLGEVKVPGTKSFTADRITVLEAIAAAGDLTDRGVRENIIVLRQEQDRVTPIRIDLTDPAFTDSPGFQLRQNDIVYVAANDLKLREVNFNPRFVRDLSITTSIASLMVLVINLVFVLSR